MEETECILVNKIQCKLCAIIIESTYCDDFVQCPCGACAVDGVKSYLKRIGDPHNYIELSVTEKKANPLAKSLLYDPATQIIKVNKIQCTVCREIIESRHVHEYRKCSCGCCGVDGGDEYLRRTGGHYIELSEFADKPVEEPMTKVTIILSNKVQCTCCNTTLISANENDFLICDCGKFAMGGGTKSLIRTSKSHIDHRCITTEQRSISEHKAIKNNKIRCNMCHVTIESTFNNDCQCCECKTCTISGGTGLLERYIKASAAATVTSSTPPFTELSEYY